MCRSHVPVAGLESRCGQLGGLLATAGPRLVVPLVARLRLRRPGWHRRLATWVLLPAAARTTGHPAQLSSAASPAGGRAEAGGRALVMADTLHPRPVASSRSPAPPR